MPSPAGAQAWVPPAGLGDVTVVYQRIDNTGHFLTDGSLNTVGGQSLDSGVALEVDYALTSRWSVSANLPYVFAKYTGREPPPPFIPFLPVDRCRCWHSGWQDFGFTARFNVANGVFALTPSLSAGIPSHDYDHRGEAVIGRHLKEVRLAIDGGRRLDVLSPRLAVEGRYSYAFVERVLGIPNNRSNVAVETSFAVTPKLSTRGTLSWQRTHGGLRGNPVEINTEERLNEHDRLLRDNSWHVGGGVSYEFPRVDVFTSYIAYAGGTNTHAGRAVTAGISWPFRIP